MDLKQRAFITDDVTSVFLHLSNVLLYMWVLKSVPTFINTSNQCILFQKLWKLCLSMENHLFLFFCSKTKFFIMASFISITVFIQIYVWIFLRLLWSLKADNIKMDWWQVARSKKTNEMLSAQIRVDDKFSNKHMFYTITGCFWYHLYSIELLDIKKFHCLTTFH